MSKTRYIAAMSVIGLAAHAAADVRAASLEFAGSDYDIGGTFFPGGSAPFVVVPWRSETNVKDFDIDGNNVYGSAGYAMFATQATYPGGSTCCGGTVPFDSATYPNLVSLPSFVSGSNALVLTKVGGWPYALIDDPTLVNGYRDYNWGTTQVPPRPGPDQSPYVMLGSLEGDDIHGNAARTSPNGAGRWEFTIGGNPPARIRVGVMTDGLNADNWTSTEVLLHRVSGATIHDTATTGTIPIGNILPPPDYIPGINRMVDIHTFDIVGAQSGETYAVYSKAFSNGFGAIAGVTFDVVPEPASVSFLIGLLATCGGMVRFARRK